jgi:hypothetical protein
MDEKIIDVEEYVEKDIKNEASFGEKFKDGFGKVKTFCGDHKVEIAAIAPVLISGTIELIKIGTRKGTVKQEKRLKDNYVYDRGAGHYYETKRKLKSSEWLMVDQRKREGENLGEILNDMKVLKK